MRDLTEARRFADVYLEYERRRFIEATGTEVSLDHARSLITDDDIRMAFYGADGSPTADERNQARLLEGLHRIVEDKRAAAADAN